LWLPFVVLNDEGAMKDDEILRFYTIIVTQTLLLISLVNNLLIKFGRFGWHILDGRI